MANSSRITRQNIPRVLQLGLDKIITDHENEYKGKGDIIFKEVKTEKAYYEAIKLAGMGVAAQKGEGTAISTDSVDQFWNYRIPVVTYEKSARITREAIKDNQYEDMLPFIGKEQLKALAHARDIVQGNILNRAFTSGYTFGDGSVLCATNHATQVGTTNSNRLAVDSDLSEDALESMILLIDGFVNDDGLKSSDDARRLIIPNALRFEAERILKNPNRPATADRDINAIVSDGALSDYIVWKRLSDSDAFFVQTTRDNGLVTIRREGIFTMTSQDHDTYDTKVTMAERYQASALDHRCIVGTPGA